MPGSREDEKKTTSFLPVFPANQIHLTSLLLAKVGGYSLFLSHGVDQKKPILACLSFRR